MAELINQGSNGCVYKPTIPCGNESTSNKYISKVQMNSESLKSEIKIGELIMKIPHYELYFAPVISNCPVNLSEIKDEIVNCEPIADDLNRDKHKYVSSKVKYIGNDIYEFLKKTPNIVETHLDLLNSIELLWKNNIVHFDLKYNNVMYDKTTKCPVIIDFGLSYLNTTPMPEYEYTELLPMSQYCIDVGLLSFLSKKDPTQTIVYDELDVICDKFADNYIFKHITKDFKSDFISKLKVDLRTITGAWQVLIDRLKPNQEHWDNYALSVIFLIFTGASEYKTLLEKVVFAMPTKRVSIQEVRNELVLFKEIKYKQPDLSDLGVTILQEDETLMR